MGDNQFEDEIEPRGWNAIEDALEILYKDKECTHFEADSSYEDPLDGISVYKNSNSEEHWHYITFGFSELYEKETDNPEFSGYGFELTFRLKREKNDKTVPLWPITLLQNVARYLFSTGNVFEVGHYMHSDEPISSEEDKDSKLYAIAFVNDPELKPIDTPNGRVAFLQVAGITADEEEAMKCWNGIKIMELLGKKIPLYITDVKRDSFLKDKEISRVINEGIEKDGSSTGTLFINQLKWKEKKDKKVEITIGEVDISTLSKLLNGRIAKKRELVLVGEKSSIEFKYSEKSFVKVEKELLKINLNRESLNELLSLLEQKVKSFELESLNGVKFFVEK